MDLISFFSISYFVDLLVNVFPLMVILIIYFVRLERKLSRMSTDIEWIKKFIIPCLPTSEKDTK